MTAIDPLSNPTLYSSFPCSQTPSGMKRFWRKQICRIPFFFLGSENVSRVYGCPSSVLKCQAACKSLEFLVIRAMQIFLLCLVSGEFIWFQNNISDFCVPLLNYKKDFWVFSLQCHLYLYFTALFSNLFGYLQKAFCKCDRVQQTEIVFIHLFLCGTAS